MAQIEKVVKLGLREVEFDLVEGFERVAEVNQDQVALVAELGEERRLDGRGRVRLRSRRRSTATASVAIFSRSPSAQDRQAFQSKRKTGEAGSSLQESAERGEISAQRNHLKYSFELPLS